MTNFLFKEFLSFLKRLEKGGISLTNRNLVILDGHGFHVTLKAIEQTQALGLNMITSPSHTSHALQLLDVAYFKPFKTTLQKKEML
jgi:hypothetical protein